MRARYPGVLARILFLIPLVALQTIGAQAQPTGRSDVAGVVVDAQKAPIPSVEVTLKPKGEQSRLAVSDTAGRFKFAGVPAGPVVLTVRRIGFAAKTIDIDVTGGGVVPPIEVSLEAVATEMPSVVVEESRQHLAEFYDRKANSNFAKFFDQKDIKKRNPLYLSEMIRTVAGADVSSAGAGNRILLRGCKPMVWVDGMRAQGAELDEVVRPSDIAGLEVYPSNAGLPAGYQDRNNRMCGAIIVWTRNQ